ncbi:MAG: hypothetical protein AB1705_26925 [Verrucomicrobiota bacterium]
MSSFFDQLNLRPQERRLVVGLLLVFFFIINFWLIWPQFKEWDKVKEDLRKAQARLDKYEAEIAQVSSRKQKLESLEAQGSDVLPAEQAFQFSRTVQMLAQRNKVTISTLGSPTSSRGMGANTNAFFDEQNISMTVISGEAELVNLLVALASDSSLIRVRDLTLRAERPKQQQLSGTLKLVASYQKK